MTAAWTQPDNRHMRRAHESDTNTGVRRLSAMGLIVAMGIVFGDIGTSPLYVMKAITGACREFDADYIIGAVSCVIWTLTLQTTVKYVLVALRADNRGEGGILALYALLRQMRPQWLYVVAAIGSAALVADGVITPAITVSSAVEGLRVFNPGLPVVLITIGVILGIFLMQQAGTGTIGRFFGPFMLVWFLMLGVLGIANVGAYMPVFKAFNPVYAFRLLFSSPEWFLIMGAVFLCTTGAEALYSDLGHCGRKNISISWILVKICLILNYLGQGAWIIGNGCRPTGENPFFAIMPGWFAGIGVVMSAGAAVIASQALLSGSFTIFSEAISLGLWPRLRIKYPSVEKGQLYIPAVNMALLAGCLITVLIFRDSSRMEAAYGLAITVTMLMTTVLLSFWMVSRGVPKTLCLLFAAVFGSIEGIFFVANLFKFSHGGWYSIGIAAILASVMVLWLKSTCARASYIEYRDVGECLPLIKAIKEDGTISKYTSNLVYFSRSADMGRIESKIVYSIVNKLPKRADHYWFIHIENVDAPDTLEYSVGIPAPGTVYFIRMRLGFRVEPKVTAYLRQVVEDLVDDGLIDLRSTYPSLRERDIPGDFRFMIIHRIFSPSSNCRRRDRRLMLVYQLLRRLGISDEKAMGLETSVVTEETVPLIINTTPPRRIRRISSPDHPESLPAS